VSAAGNASGGDTPPVVPTLSELAEKLSQLKEHLDQVVADLNAPREDEGASANCGLRCHECGGRGAAGAAGWTRRLCGDDALHVFCPDCDHRFFNGDAGESRPTEPSPVPPSTP